MKILLLAARFPYPADRGDRLTTVSLLRALSDRHAVTLVSFRDGHEPPGATQAVATLCRRVETVYLSRARSWAQAWIGLASSLPSQVSYFHSSAMNLLVERLCREEQFDVIFAQTFRMAPFVRGLRHPAKVLFFGDSLRLALSRSMPFQPRWRRPGVAWECARVSRFEADVAREFRECWALSEEDVRDFEARGCINVVLLPHGVEERLFDLPLAPRSGARLLFVGNLSVPHNVDAALFLAREVWPRILSRVPGATLSLAGASPARAVRALGRLPGVHVTGPVPDLTPLWQQSAVAIAPLRFSTGIQNKVLEPMAAGVPVVTTPQVAGAIGARDREHLRIGRNAEDLAAAAVEVLSDPEGQRPMLERARTLVRQGFSWDNFVRRLEQMAQGMR